MSKYFYNNQTPIYRSPDLTKSITLDTSNNQLIIQNTTIPKTIIINSEEFSNGTQSLPYTQMYTKINAVEAAVYPPPNGTTLQVQDTILLTNSGLTGPTGQIKIGASTFDISSSQDIVIDPSSNLVVDGTLDMSGNEITKVSKISNIGDITIDPSNNLVVDGTINVINPSIVPSTFVGQINNQIGRLTIQYNQAGSYNYYINQDNAIDTGSIIKINNEQGERPASFIYSGKEGNWKGIEMKVSNDAGYNQWGSIGVLDTPGDPVRTPSLVFNQRTIGETMRITNGGLVGLSEQNPVARLTANGDIVAENRGVLGTEQVVNGGFTDGSNNWIVGNGWSFNSGVMTFDPSANPIGTLSQNVGVIANAIYQITFTISNATQGFLVTSLGGVSSRRVFNNGTYTFIIKASNTGNLTFTPTIYYGSPLTTPVFNGSIDNITVRRVLGGNISAYGVFNGGGSGGIKVDVSGNVGVGTTVPTTLLDVSGNIRASTSLTTPLINNTGNITIDPSNNLIIAGTLDMSLNNITRVNTIGASTSLTITDSTYNAVLLSNELSISDNAGETSSLTNAELNIQDATGNSSVLNKTSLNITDSVVSTTLNNTRLQFNNPTTYSFIELNNSNQLWLENGNTYPIILNSSNSQITIGDVSNNGNLTKIAVDDTTRKTELNSVDILSNCNIVGSSYTLPINFTNKFNGSYTLNNSNSWEMVASNTINIPLGLYTQTNGFNIWKMDFAINCVNMTIQDDNAYAMYLEIRDVNGSGNDYQGWLFNQTTPYTTWKNPSTYNNTSNSSENYVYTDYYDFSSATGSPLEIRLFRYGDNPMSCNFSWLLTFSKTNLV